MVSGLLSVYHRQRSLCSLERLWPLVTFVIGVLIMAACIIVKLGHAHTVLKHVGLSGEHSLLETMVTAGSWLNLVLKVPENLWLMF